MTRAEIQTKAADLWVTSFCQKLRRNSRKKGQKCIDIVIGAAGRALTAKYICSCQEPTRVTSPCIRFR